MSFGIDVNSLLYACNVEVLMALPQCRVISEQEGSSWASIRQVSGEVPTRGNLVPDAHLAAVLPQSGVATLYTHDRDFRRSAFLDVRDPLVG